MAKTKTSAYGKQKQKIVPVRSYKRNGKRIKPHRRSTRNKIGCESIGVWTFDKSY